MQLRRYYTCTDPETGEILMRRAKSYQKRDPYRTGIPTPSKPSKGQRAERKRQQQERFGFILLDTLPWHGCLDYVEPDQDSTARTLGITW
jgi:hypothetical protein